MYRPNFCAECGSGVERLRWRVWTSGRFCPACEKRLGGKRLVAGATLCACLLALGFGLGRAARHAPPRVVIERQFSAAAATTVRAGIDGAAAGDGASTGRTYGPDGAADERPTDPLEVVSVCGARTKKGTPCSRRVRGIGRCWQHRGKPAILPKDKLTLP